MDAAGLVEHDQFLEGFVMVVAVAIHGMAILRQPFGRAQHRLAHRLAGQHAIADRHDAVDLARNAGVVADDDGGDAHLARQRAEGVVDEARRRRVDLARGFVGQQQRRVVGQPHGDRHALLLAARQLR